MRKNLFGELCAEFAGTMILILFGTAVVAQVLTTAKTDAPAGEHDAIAWSWGIAARVGPIASRSSSMPRWFCEVGGVICASWMMPSSPIT